MTDNRGIIDCILRMRDSNEAIEKFLREGGELCPHGLSWDEANWHRAKDELEWILENEV